MTICIYDGELIFMPLTNGSDCVFNLCSSARFRILQDLMKQGQGIPIVNPHFKQYQAMKYLDIYQLHQAGILSDQAMFLQASDLQVK